MLAANSSYKKISLVVLFCFVVVFAIYTVFTFYLIKSNIQEETDAAMSQATLMRDNQVSVAALERILSQSPHIEVSRFSGRLSENRRFAEGDSLARFFLEQAQPIIIPVAENNYLIISPNQDAEFQQNIVYFWSVFVLFFFTLGLLLIALRSGVQHQLKPLKSLTLAIQKMADKDGFSGKQASVFPTSNITEIQTVIDEFLSLNAKLTSKDQALLEMDKKLAILQEEERSYLAQELHDNVGQLLTSIKAYAHILTYSEEPSLIAEMAQKIKQLSQQVSQAISSLTQRLNPLIFEQVTLEQALCHLANEMRSLNSQIEWQIDIDIAGIRINYERDIHIYRIIQEALNNIIKHAQATAVSLKLVCNDKYIDLRLVDDGKGFSSLVKHGVGIFSMRNRARCIGAELTLTSAPDKGTEIRLRLANEEGEQGV